MKKEACCEIFDLYTSYKENTLKEEFILEQVIQCKKEFNLTIDALLNSKTNKSSLSRIKVL